MSLGILAEDGQRTNDWPKMRDFTVSCVHEECMTSLVPGWVKP